MDKESQTCSLCSLIYNTTDRLPRVLNCAHTLCSLCLSTIIDTPGSRKCPFDSNDFNATQKSLESFPLNFALLTLLEREKQKTCQIHGGELTDICFQDKVKICSDCASEEHKGHSIKKIKDLKAKGIQARKDLEERLEKFEKNPFGDNKEVETLKNTYLSKLGSKFGEINKILKDKQQEWRKQMENLFERDMDSQLKEEASLAIEEIDQAFKNEESLVMLDRDFSSIISRLQPQVVSKEEFSSLSDEISKMMDCLEPFLTNQINSLNRFHLSNDKGKPEEPMTEERPEPKQELPPENLNENHQKPGIIKVSRFVRLRLLVDSFCVHINNHTPQNLSLDVAKYPKIPQMSVKLEGYETFFKDPADLSCLSQILSEFNSYSRLAVEFHPLDLNDDYVLRLFQVLFCRIENLTHLKIHLGKCGISDDPIFFFCENILPKAISLKHLTLKLNETKVTNESFLKLAESLDLLSTSTKLKSLTIKAGYTGIQDDAIEKLFDVILGAKTLRLYLEGTGVTDRSLKMLGSKVMPEMKNLKKFSLNVKETEITIRGANAIFTGIPEGIRELNLGFENANLPDEVISLFEQNVCPKLQLVKDLSLRLDRSDSEYDDDEEV